jgi:hypothetical protein
VRSTVQEKNPIAICMGRPELPAIEEDAIVGADDEVFTGRASVLRSLIGLGYLPLSESAANGVKNSGLATLPRPPG